MKSNIGSSILADAKQAGIQAATAAKAGLSDVKIAFVYCSCAYDVSAVMAGVAEVLPGVPALGNTSFTGLIVPEGFIGGDDPFVGVLVLSDPELKVAVAAVEKNECAVSNGKALGEALVEQLGCAKPDALYMAASPAEEEFYLKGISSVIGRVPFFGGSAADNAIAGEWKLFCNDTVFADGCIAAAFKGIKITNLFTGAYRETDDFGVITKIDGNRTLCEIDGIPAADKFMQWTGCSREAVSGGNLLVTTITSPLGVKDRLGDLIAIRHPMAGNEDGSFAIGANLAEKTCVIRMEATVDELIASVPNTLSELLGKLDHKPAALHLVHCGGRRAGIGDRIGEVVTAVQQVAGDIPFVVEFTFGEYGYVSDNNNTTGGLMLSFTAID